MTDIERIVNANHEARKKAAEKRRKSDRFFSCLAFFGCGAAAVLTGLALYCGMWIESALFAVHVIAFILCGRVLR